MSEDFGLDIYQESDLNAIKADAIQYCLNNERKFQICTKTLESKSAIQQKIDVKTRSRKGLFSLF